MSKIRGRPISVGKIRSDFSHRITDIEKFYHSGVQVFSLKDHRRTLSEYSLLSAAVSWEVFLSDLFIAYARNNQSKAKEHMEKIFIEGLSKRQALIFNRFVEKGFAKNLGGREEVAEILDMDERNITFSEYKEIIKHARNWLMPEDAQKFEISEDKRAVVNLVISIRNRIAHRSEKSKKNTAKSLKQKRLDLNLKRGGESEKGSVNGIDKPGVYLETKPTGHQQPRLLIILSHLKEVSENLCPTNLPDSS